MDSDLEALASSSSNLVEAFGGVTADRSGWATPCSDWDLADLVDHVVGGNWFTTKILEGQAPDAALAQLRSRFEARRPSTGDAIASVREQSTAFERPDVLERIWHHVAGKLTGRQILRLRLHDLIIHTWDIQQTIDPPASVPAPLLKWGLAELSAPSSLTAGHFGIGPNRAGERPADDAATYLGMFDRHL